MSYGLSIPFDVLEKIIDILAADDDENSTLVKPCALICRSLLHRSRTHIFRKITVGLPTNLTEKRLNLFWGIPSRLCRLISHTPELANHVRVLEIGIGAGEKYYAEGRRLASTLRRFKHIESLMLSAQCPPRNSGIKLLNWKNVSLPLQQAILSLMQLQTLKGLNLWKMIFPIFQMKIGGNVRSLRMADVNFYALDDDGPRTWPTYPSAVQPIQLHEYGMSNDGGAQSKKLLKATRSDGRPVFDFGHLRSLTAELYFLPRDLDVVQDIINKTTHLTTLFLTIKCYSGTWALGAFLGGLPDAALKTLKTLTIKIQRAIFPAWFDSPMFGLTDGLEAMNRRYPNVLEKLVYCEPLLADSLPGAQSVRAELEKLDAALGSPNWPCLKEVSLGFTLLCRHSSASAEEVETVLREQKFPVLTAREPKVSVSIDIFDQ